MKLLVLVGMTMAICYGGQVCANGYDDSGVEQQQQQRVGDYGQQQQLGVKQQQQTSISSDATGYGSGAPSAGGGIIQAANVGYEQSAPPVYSRDFSNAAVATSSATAGGSGVVGGYGQPSPISVGGSGGYSAEVPQQLLASSGAAITADNGYGSGRIAAPSGGYAQDSFSFASGISAPSTVSAGYGQQQQQAAPSSGGYHQVSVSSNPPASVKVSSGGYGGSVMGGYGGSYSVSYGSGYADHVTSSPLTITSEKHTSGSYDIALAPISSISSGYQQNQQFGNAGSGRLTTGSGGGSYAGASIMTHGSQPSQISGQAYGGQQSSDASYGQQQQQLPISGVSYGAQQQQLQPSSGGYGQEVGLQATSIGLGTVQQASSNGYGQQPQPQQATSGGYGPTSGGYNQQQLTSNNFGKIGGENSGGYGPQKQQQQVHSSGSGGGYGPQQQQQHSTSGDYGQSFDGAGQTSGFGQQQQQSISDGYGSDFDAGFGQRQQHLLIDGAYGQRQQLQATSGVSGSGSGYGQGQQSISGGSYQQPSISGLSNGYRPQQQQLQPTASLTSGYAQQPQPLTSGAANAYGQQQQFTSGYAQQQQPIASGSGSYGQQHQEQQSTSGGYGQTISQPRKVGKRPGGYGKK